MANALVATMEFFGPFQWVAQPDSTETQEAFLVGPFQNSFSEPDRWTPHFNSVAVLEHPGLFKTFAKLKTGGEISTFANRFGLLGANPEAQIDGGDSGERFTLWQDSILLMRDAIALWDALRLDPPDLMFLEKRVVQSSGMEHNIYFVRSDGNASAHGDSIPDVDPRKLERVEQGALCLAEMIERQLEGSKYTRGVAPSLAWLSRGDHAPRFSLQFQAATLKAALWLQLAQAVAENTTFLECAVCGKPIPIGRRGGGGRRSDSLTCGDLCRKNKSRQKRRAAHPE